MAWFEPDAEEQEFFREIGNLPDRVVGLLAPILVERRLEAVVRIRTNKSTGVEVGTFGQQIDLVSKRKIFEQALCDDLRAIKDIRNHFAHELSARNFAVPEIAQKVAAIGVIERYPSDHPLATAKNEFFMPLHPFFFWIHSAAVAPTLPSARDSANPALRYRFLRSCEMVSYCLHYNAQAARR